MGGSPTGLIRDAGSSQVDATLSMDMPRVGRDEADVWALSSSFTRRASENYCCRSAKGRH